MKYFLSIIVSVLVFSSCTKDYDVFYNQNSSVTSNTDCFDYLQEDAYMTGTLNGKQIDFPSATCAFWPNRNGQKRFYLDFNTCYDNYDRSTLFFINVNPRQDTIRLIPRDEDFLRKDGILVANYDRCPDCIDQYPPRYDSIVVDENYLIIDSITPDSSWAEGRISLSLAFGKCWDVGKCTDSIYLREGESPELTLENGHFRLPLGWNTGKPILPIIPEKNVELNPHSVDLPKRNRNFP